MMELSSIGRYQLLQVIGRGGMGLVYLAQDPILQRLVAIKVLAPHLASDETIIARFINEARIAASLQAGVEFHRSLSVASGHRKRGNGISLPCP